MPYEAENKVKYKFNHPLIVAIRTIKKCPKITLLQFYKTTKCQFGLNTG